MIDETGACADAGAGRQAQEDARREGGRGDRRDDGAHPAEDDHQVGLGSAAEPGEGSQAPGVRPGQRHRAADRGDQAVARGPARTGKADRLLPVLRPHRRRQDRGRQAVGQPDGRRAAALRHVRVHGEAHGQPLDRRASGLRRLRSGRSVDRRHRSASAFRAAAGRDREGASRPVQHPVAGDGSRHADRSQRQEDRLPQRRPDHDDQRGRVRHGQAGDGLQPLEAGRRGQRGDQPDVHAGVPQPPRRGRDLRRARPGDHPQGRREVRAAARGPAGRSRRHDRADRRGRQVAGREGLRREVRRAAAGPHDPGVHQEAARRRAAVRQARARRLGQGEDRREGRGSKDGEKTIGFEIVAAPPRKGKPKDHEDYDGEDEPELEPLLEGGGSVESLEGPAAAIEGAARSGRRGTAEGRQARRHRAAAAEEEGRVGTKVSGFRGQVSVR